MSRWTDRAMAHPRLAGLIARLNRSHVTRRFASGAGWTMAGNVAWKALAAIANILIGRILGPQGLGELGVVRSTASVFETIAGLRMGPTATRFVAEHRIKDPPRAARILKLSLASSAAVCGVLAIVLAATAPLIAADVFNDPRLTTLLALGAALVFFNAFGRVQEFAIAGFERFRSIAAFNVGRGVASLAIVVPLAYVFGVLGALSGLLLVSGAVMIGYAVNLRRQKIQAGFPARIAWRELRGELPILWEFTLPSLISGVILVGVMWGGRAMLANQDGGFAQVGVFEAANQLRLAIMFLPQMLAQVVVPILAEAHGRGHTADFTAAMRLQVQSVCLATLPIVLVLIGFAEPLAGLFGAAFAGLPPVIALLAIAAFTQANNMSIARTFDGIGRRWAHCGFFVVWGLVFVAAAIPLIPAMGALGMAAAYAVAEATMLVLQALYVDLVLMPGLLRGNAGVFAFSVMLLAAGYLAHQHLPAVAAMAISVALCAIGLWPIASKLRAGKPTDSVKGIQ